MNQDRNKTKLQIIAYCLLLAVGLLAYKIYADSTVPVTAEPEDRVITIALDAGHGGADGGAVGIDTGVVESGLNLTIVRLVESGLLEAGYNVVLTRTDEKALGTSKQADMQERKKIIRGDEIDLVISIHMNKFRDRSVNGPMVFYMKNSTYGSILADHIIRSICEAVGRKPRFANPGDYFMIRECKVPAVIVECGFLSNPTDEKLLQDPDYQKKLAEGIIAGIKAYIEAGEHLGPIPTPEPSSS